MRLSSLETEELQMPASVGAVTVNGFSGDLKPEFTDEIKQNMMSWKEVKFD